MSDAEDDVHVCDICQEIFLGNDELEEHMKEDHAMKEEPATKEVVFLLISTLSVHMVQFFRKMVTVRKKERGQGAAQGRSGGERKRR